MLNKAKAAKGETKTQVKETNDDKDKSNLARKPGRPKKKTVDADAKKKAKIEKETNKAIAF